MKNAVLLSTAYFAPIPFYALAVQSPKIYIERFENFIKQTYRNRCVILGANGPISLIVPVIKGRGSKVLIKDLKISYDTGWQKNHWRTIFSAYNSSPFFDYFKDDIFPFFEKKEKFLLDLNQKTHETVCELLEITGNIILTDGFENSSEKTVNLREVISPKNKMIDHQFQTESYTQVFSEKFGFVPNLSILDLLFNEGPNSYTFLEQSDITVS